MKPSHTPQILIILEITNGKKLVENWTTCTLGDAKNQNLTWNYKFNFLANPWGPYYMGIWTIKCILHVWLVSTQWLSIETSFSTPKNEIYYEPQPLYNHFKMHVNYNELQHGFDVIPTMQQTNEHK